MERAAAARHYPWPAEVMLRDPDHLLFRLSSLRLDRSSHPVPTDTVAFLLRAAIPAVVHHPDLSTAERCYQLGVLTLVARATCRRREPGCRLDPCRPTEAGVVARRGSLAPPRCSASLTAVLSGRSARPGRVRGSTGRSHAGRADAG